MNEADARALVGQAVTLRRVPGPYFAAGGYSGITRWSGADEPITVFVRGLVTAGGALCLRGDDGQCYALDSHEIDEGGAG